MVRNAVILCVFSVLITIIFLPSYTHVQDLRLKNAEYDRQIYALKRNKIKLLEEKHLLEENPEYLEKVAREKMGLIKDNEVVFKIMPSTEVQIIQGQ
jgi:cell division protein FtsB